MAEQRDPRRDPRPGDRLEFDKHERWEPLAVVDDQVQYVLAMNLPICSMSLVRWMSLKCWRMLAKSATVLHTAPEADHAN